MHPFFKALSTYHPLSESTSEAVLSALQPLTLKAGQIFLKEGQLCDRLFFLERGLVRSWIRHKNRDKTYWFYRESDIFTSWFSFSLGMPAFEYFEAIEPCTLWWLSRNDFETLADHAADLARATRRLLLIQLGLFDLYNRHFTGLDAKEKYAYLLEHMPDLVVRAKLAHVASFLDISQETLSRVRSQARLNPEGSSRTQED